MAKTLSTMLPLGTRAPEFALPAPDGTLHTLADVSSGAKALVVAFICNHCPYVKHLKRELADLARDYRAQGVATVAIMANDVANYPDDAPDKMRADSETFGYTFPYLLDDTQEVAKAYQAACTPDFYVFDGNLKLTYRGRFDDSTPGNDKPVTGAELKAAIDAVLAGEGPLEDQKPSMGCNIKWKAGNEPPYFG